jgi:hypothetical protein
MARQVGHKQHLKTPMMKGLIVMKERPSEKVLFTH